MTDASDGSLPAQRNFKPAQPTPKPAQPTPKPPIWRVWRWPLHFQILLGLVIGGLVGWGLGEAALGQYRAGDVGSAAEAATGSPLFQVLDLGGDLFLSGLKLIIVPLVVSSIVLSLVNIGRGAGVGRLGAKTLAYYGMTSFLAIMVGLVLVNLVAPGVASSEGLDAAGASGGSGGFGGRGLLVGEDLGAFASEQQAIEDKTGGKSASDFLGVFRAMVPPNVFAAASDNGQLLGLIVVALVVGFFLARMDNDEGRTLVRFTQGVYDLAMRVTELVLRFAPIGVLGLIGATVAEQYAKLASEGRFGELGLAMLKFAGVAVGALAVHLLITMPLVLTLLARVNPIRHYRAMAPALMTAFSTASSASTLPVTLECVEHRAGVSKKTTSFVLPLGATVNMDGTALYECVAAMFICQAFGIDLTLSQQFLVVITALLTSIGVAGVPSASLVAIVIILQAVQNNLPPGALPEGVLLVSGLGLLLIFDRPLDMCRTAVNVFSDSVGAVVIAKSEGERVLVDR